MEPNNTNGQSPLQPQQISPQNQDQFNPSNTRKKILKWVLILIIVFSVVILFFVAIFIIRKFIPSDYLNPWNEAPMYESLLKQQQQEDIKNWKTYKNERFGFEWQYPQDWIVESAITMSPDKKARFVETSNQCDFYNNIGEYKYRSYSTTTGDFVRNDCSHGLSVSLMIQTTASSTALSEEFNKYQNTLEKILSTVKLSGNIDSWNVYKNDNLFFEFKYPEGFRLSTSTDSYDIVVIYMEMLDNGAWGPTNFFVVAQKTTQTTESLKNTEKDWEPIKFQGLDALLIGAKSFCNKKIVFVNNRIRYEIASPTNCDIPNDIKISQIFESFRVINPVAELQSNILNGKTYKSETRSFEFNYPNNWLIQEGPVTANTIFKPEVILVRFTPKSSVSKNSQHCSDNGYCETIVLDNGIKVFVKYDPNVTHLPTEYAQRMFKNQLQKYFDDYTVFKDATGNEISIDFLSTLNRDDAGKLIKAVLSTFKFTK